MSCQGLLPGLLALLASPVFAEAQQRDPASELAIGASCTDCHAEIVESYRAGGMARALDGIRPGEFAGLKSVLETQTGFQYHFEGDGKNARIVEKRAATSLSGRRPHRDSGRLAFAIGAGVLDRSYAVAKHERLWFAPLEVVSSADGNERHAALAPGHAMKPGSRFSVPITPECLACHTDLLPPRDWPQNRIPPPEAWRPRGISCGACHCGGEAHVDWRSRELLGQEPAGEDPILNPAHLGRTQRMSLCAGCHLQGDARIELEPGNLAPPAPGGDLLEHRAIFVASQATEEVGFVSHVERLVLSRCYLETSADADGLSCSSCHDPHRPLQDPLERKRVRDGCSRCHAPHNSSNSSCPLSPARKKGRDCVECHMRRTGVFDVAHVRIHDHWIRKRPGPAAEAAPLRFPESATGDWRAFRWPDAEPPSHHDDPGLWMMALYTARHMERAASLLTRESAFDGKLAMYHHVRGVLLEMNGQFDAAVKEYRQAIRIDPDLAESVSNLGLLHGRMGATDVGLRVLDGLIERHPGADGALRNRSLIKRAGGDTQGFLKDLEASMKLLPSPEVARALASEWRKRGRPERARFWEEEALRLSGGR
jgi:hypothetical protein